MNYDPTKHYHRSTRLKGYDYSASGGYFITICTHQREYLFGRIINGVMVLNEFGIIVAEEWERSPTMRQNIELDTSVIMPNHFHETVKITDTVGTQSLRSHTTTSFPHTVAPITLGGLGY